ncbi:type II secretion system protein GspD [Longimicrobium sp.]|uniref:type II secretion system protein GspD n=1 Tax=Longimicrobium sp. TaxID=2029185 RepID=UPI003B3B6275
MRRRLFAAGLAALACAAPLAAQGTPGVQRTARGIMIDFQGTDLRLVVPALAEAAGVNITYGELPQRPVTLRTPAPVDAPGARRFLESVLRANDLELRDEGGGILRVISVAQAPVQQPAAQPDASAFYTPGAGQGGVQVFVHRLRHAPAEDVARSIGALFGLGDGSIDARRPRSLSQELRDQALPQNGEPMSGGVSARPQGLATDLSGNVQIFADQRTNSLLIRASPGDYATVRQAIEQIDTRPLQVLIEVLIAEVRHNRQFGLGLTVQLPEQGLEGTDTRIGGELIGGGDGDVVLRITRLGGVDANVVLRALATSGNVNILSRPVILAQNNEEARILVGTQRPFIQISRALPTDNAARDQVIQYRDVGTQLTIRPTINPDGYVTLTVLQEVSTATSETQFGAPVIATREAETRLLVKDDQTVVIGGLIDQQRTTSSSGIPFLKDLPLIGGLFRSSSRNTNTTELFLFLTPHVIFTDEDMEQATDRVRQNAPRLDRALPDSIPLYWELRSDTLVIPTGPQSGSLVPQPEQAAPRDTGSPTSSAPLPASTLAAARSRSRRAGVRRRAAGG